MTRKLNDADRAAVDLVFDRINAAGEGSSGGNGNGHGGNGVVLMNDAVPEERLSAVQRILSVLDEMPAPEPSADLATRTLGRIARDTGTPALAPAASQFIDPTQPMA